MRVILTGLFVALAVAACDRIEAQSASVLRQIGTIALPKVTGRIDHLAFDPSTGRLFVAARENDTVEVLDTANAAHFQSVRGFHKPQGVAVVGDLGGVAIANGDAGTLQLLDTHTLATRWVTAIGDDADNVRYDPTAKRLYVAAQGGLYVVDPSTGKRVGQVPIDGHPESFQLENSGPRLFVNLPGLLKSRVITADRQAMKGTAQWPTHDCGGNYPMALDEETSRLFIGCRRPARLEMVDTRSGAFITVVGIMGDTDDLFYDAARRRLFVIGGEGFVDVITREGDELKRIGRVNTRAGARTGMWVQAQSRLYVAVPDRGSDSAEVRVYEAERQ